MMRVVEFRLWAGASSDGDDDVACYGEVFIISGPFFLPQTELELRHEWMP